MNLVGGLMAALAVLAVPVLARFAIAYVRSDGEFDAARAATSRWTMAVAAGAGTTVATGLITISEAIGGVVDIVAGSPLAVSNLSITALGAGALSGVVDIAPRVFVGLAIAILGIVVMTREVDQYV